VQARDFESVCAGLLGDRAGALLVADPRSGRLLAMVHPAIADAPFPPGSVFKLVTALAAMQAGVDTPGHHYRCDGRFTPLGHGPSRPCWKPGGHGSLSLEEAIANSCNVSFYQLGERTGTARLRETARLCGLGLAPGRLPRANADPLDTSIGEGGNVVVTPRQLLGFVSAIATDGRLRAIAWQARPLGARAIGSAQELARLRAGMVGSVQFGSSRKAQIHGLALAGKTGTATYTDDSNRTYGWFIGFAPVGHPRLAVVVFLKQANGFADAAPLGGRVFRAWLAAGQP
jgi:penicillin-binding protein 2